MGGSESTSRPEAGALAAQSGLDVEQVKAIMSHWPNRESLKLDAFKEVVAKVRALFPTIKVLHSEGFADEIFVLFDKNHDGRVSYSEFLGGLAILAKGDQVERAKMLFYACDANNDGQVTKAEFIKALKASMNSCKTLVKAQLTDYMTKTSGGSFATGLLSSMILSAVSFDADRFANLAFMADTDHNGTLSMEEWLASFQSNQAIARLFAFASGDLIVAPSALTGDTERVVRLLALEFPALSDATITGLINQYNAEAAKSTNTSGL
ncbi:visinin-like protein 1 [Pelomyxa schiedti]|nr:visinin-like protein 1 [Pelomyxa schiedti]